MLFAKADEYASALLDSETSKRENSQGNVDPQTVIQVKAAHREFNTVFYDLALIAPPNVVRAVDELYDVLVARASEVTEDPLFDTPRSRELRAGSSGPKMLGARSVVPPRRKLLDLMREDLGHEALLSIRVVESAGQAAGPPPPTRAAD